MTYRQLLTVNLLFLIIFAHCPKHTTYKRYAESIARELRVIEKAWRRVFAPHPLGEQAGQSPACQSLLSKIQ